MMKGKIIVLLALILIIGVSATVFVLDIHTDTIRADKTELLKERSEKGNESNITAANSSFPKSKLTFAILFLGGVGLAVFRRNSFV